jgi:hypothetical protein
MAAPVKHKWAFSSRFRKNTFGGRKTVMKRVGRGAILKREARSMTPGLFCAIIDPITNTNRGMTVSTSQFGKKD